MTPSLSQCTCGAKTVRDGNAHADECAYALDYGRWEAARELEQEDHEPEPDYSDPPLDYWERATVRLQRTGKKVGEP